MVLLLLYFHIIQKFQETHQIPAFVGDLKQYSFTFELNECIPMKVAVFLADVETPQQRNSSRKYVDASIFLHMNGFIRLFDLFGRAMFTFPIFDGCWKGIIFSCSIV